jgi:hypothetical protein
VSGNRDDPELSVITTCFPCRTIRKPAFCRARTAS